ncbi:hypothetical protein B0J15DRAFT_561386 [Fusarium solani]|uniref:Uncharacterized protein n=1 Tax=Fusarium solani TaxID=169388 RepID=A0A9P9H446_FUSSL|nr:uncharacterized protein B0J15DRAFT_561386 [Fusarium solani]KAH7250825.1 hypothetical protein B0J15DRAFT_561386 [Fusarium solani]
MSRFRYRIADSSIVKRFRTLLRSLGLGILTFLRGDDEEPPKVLLEKSRWVALARCAVHLVPAFLSIGLSALNLVRFFIGKELHSSQHEDDFKLGLLQIAAKVQELLVVASIGVVILHFLRSQLVFGDGLPLGLLVSGFSFTSASYFWSAEFLGVFVGGALALLAGPAAAMLMIPRTLDWDIGGGVFWLNGSDAQLWPTRLNSDYYSEVDCTTGAGPFLNRQCPSFGFLYLYQHFASWWIPHTGHKYELRDGFIRKNIYARPALLAEANTWAYTSHQATATMEDAMRGIHQGAIDYLANHHPQKAPFRRHLKWAIPQRYEVETMAPAARVFCQAQGEMNLWGDTLTVKFPDFDGVDEYYKTHSNKGEPGEAPVVEELDVLGDIKKHLAKRGLIDDTKSPLNKPIFGQSRPVIMAPVDLWNITGNSLGVVMLFEPLWNRTNGGSNPPSNVLACSIDARWAKENSVLSVIWTTKQPHEFFAGRVLNLVRTELERQGSIGYNRAAPPKNDSLRVIRMDTDWYDLLAPSLPDTVPENMHWLPQAGSKMTTLETIVSSVYHENLSQQQGFESMIAATVVDGLSRCGIIPNIQPSQYLTASPVHPGDPEEIFSKPESLKSGDSKRFVMRAIYTGYVMTAESWFDYISIAGLLLHAAIALLHTIYVVKTGTTSGAWDSILELIVLSQKSTPPPESILANTSARVQSFKTVKSVVWVETSEEAAASGSEFRTVPRGELQLRIKDAFEPRDEKLKPVVGVAYGVTEMGYRSLAERNGTFH